jgi:hypothetical protein
MVVSDGHDTVALEHGVERADQRLPIEAAAGLDLVEDKHAEGHSGMGMPDTIKAKRACKRMQRPFRRRHTVQNPVETHRE